MVGEQWETGRSRVERFTDLEVWRLSHDLFLEVFRELEELPTTRASAALTDQLVRSIGSIGANIAEGFNRSRAKYLSALDIALGEANETENWLYKIRDAGLIQREKVNDYIKQAITIQKMLSALRRSIKKHPDGR